MDAQITPIIISNWLQWVAATIIGSITAGLVYLFHNKADREELRVSIEAVKTLTMETRKDLSELRTALLTKAFHDERR